MRQLTFILCLILFAVIGNAQAPYLLSTPEKDYLEAKEYFMQENYALAYPVLKNLKEQFKSPAQLPEYMREDVQYYYLVTALQLSMEAAAEEAKNFINDPHSSGRQHMVSYHLAHYYFNKNDFARAALYYEQAGYDNLSNDAIANGKFELAYSYFMMEDFDKSKPLFNEIHQLGAGKYYYESNYYYGLLTFRDKEYDEALKAFQEVVSLPKYQSDVPYYLAQIFYFQGEKENALLYAQNALEIEENPADQKELNLLIGQIFYEQKEFKEALPYLENYVNQSEKVTREVMYELSYCYFDAGRTDEAINGFRQLSGGQDSLGQNSMYLLGSLYLQKGDKINARNAFQFSADNNSNPYQQEVSRFNYGKLSFELGHPSIALATMNQFVQAYPNSEYNKEAKEIIVQLLARSNNFADAYALYQSFDQPSPQLRKVYPSILFGRATELINEQKLEDATILLNQITKDNSAGKIKNAAYFWLGEIAFKQDRYQDAINFFTNYLQSPVEVGDANSWNARYSLGYSYLNTGKYAEAIQNFTTLAPTIDGVSPELWSDAYLRAADAYFMSKNYSTAKTRYRRIVDINSKQSDYALYQIATIDGINSPSEKIKTLNSLIQQYPTSPLAIEAYIQIANTYMAQEKYSDAISYLNKVLANKSAASFYPKIYLKLGLSYYNLNKDDEALGNYQKLLAQYPQSEEAEEALENIEHIYVRKGQPKEYMAFLKSVGKSINASKADSLTYDAAEMKYRNKDCAGAITAFQNYLKSYPGGAFFLEANFYGAECASNAKDWPSAITGYQQILNAGKNKFSEKAALYLARIYYFEMKNYPLAKETFSKLKDLSTSSENTLEALRGLVRSYYQTKDYASAKSAANELLDKKGLTSDDKAIANLVLGKSLQKSGMYNEAITAFKQSVANKSGWKDEARYEIAYTYFLLNQLKTSEKQAGEIIKSGSVDYWIAKTYILLGDIYLAQNDYFNAIATYKSVADNAVNPELKEEAFTKWQKAVEKENEHSKVINPSN